MTTLNSIFTRLIRVWLVAVVVLGLFTTTALAAEPSTGTKNNTSPKSASFQWQSLQIPRALVAVGVWGDMFKWREALHHQGIEYRDAYRAQNAYHRPLVQMVNMPSQLADYQGYSTLVLINVDAPALGTERLNAIRTFVEQGGGLVVLGGYWAFERGAYAGTPLEELLPVEMKGQHDIPLVRAGARLQPTASADWKWQADFKSEPCAFFSHALSPKPNASMLLQAGDAPVLITGTFGAGRVVACGMTVNGTPPEGVLPFWDWADWPAVLGQSIEWAGANRPLQPPATATAKPTPIDADEAEKLRLEFQPLSKELIARFVAAPTAPAADAIFTLLFPENKQKIELSNNLIDALASHARDEWSQPLERVADSLNPNLEQRSVALELLGATKASTANKLLLTALEDEDVAIGAITGLTRLGETAHRPALKRLYERSLAQSDFRNYDIEASADASAGIRGKIAIGSALALYQLGEPESIARLVELHRELRLLRRVFYNAAKRRVVETDPTGIAIRAAIWKKAGDFSALEQELLQNAGPIPPSQQSPFIEFAKATTNQEDVLWLAAALHQTPSGADWSSLSQAKDGIIRRLAASSNK